MEPTNKQLEEMIAEAVAALKEPYKSRLQNVAFILEDDPSPAQRQKLNLQGGQTLLGLYEGVPLPARNGAAKLLPDKITLFRNPLLHASRDLQHLKENVRHTIWHEVAHYFGLDHRRIHELENRTQLSKGE